MGSFRCYDSSNVIATLMVTNFHLNTTDVASFQMFVYGDVVYAQTWYSDPEKLNRATFICQDGLCCCNMALISFRLFRKNLGNLPVFFWENGLPPPLAKNFPYAYVNQKRIAYLFQVSIHVHPCRSQEQTTGSSFNARIQPLMR